MLSPYLPFLHLSIVIRSPLQWQVRYPSERIQFKISSPAPNLLSCREHSSIHTITAMDNNSNNPNPAPEVDAHTDQQLPLPRGWEQCATPEGRVYYVDHNTHITTWNDPRRTYLGNESVPVPLDGPPLPSGWEAQRNADDFH